MKELDDVTLKRAIKGDRHAFKTLYEYYAPFIWKVLYSMGGRDMMTTRELVQDTFVKVHAVLGQFKGMSAFSTWLYRIAYTTALASLRRTKAYPRSATEITTISSPDRTDTFDDRELVTKILSSISAEDRFLLTAREVDHITFDELAVITGQNSGALRTRLHRLKEQIRKMFPQEIFTATGVSYE